MFRLYKGLKRLLSHGFESLLHEWSTMTLYQRFEHIIAVMLTIIISAIIVVSLSHLLIHTIRIFVFDVNPLNYNIFQDIFGMILTVLIAMEFNHSIIHVASSHRGTIQVKTVLLIAILAIARKFIVVELHTVDPLVLIAMGVAIIALGCVYWLMRERDDRILDIYPKEVKDIRYQKSA